MASILRSRDFGESRRAVTLFCAEDGLVEALVYGGPKSKLRGLASPYHSGRAWLYRDPVRDSVKLSDFDAQECYPRLREDLGLGMQAALWAELLIRTEAGGSDFGPAYFFYIEALRLLNSSASSAYPSLAFIWAYSAILGAQPELGHCCACGQGLGDAEARFYKPGSGGFLCLECQGSRPDAAFPLHAGPARYLAALGRLPMAEALRISLDQASLGQVTRFLYQLARELAQGELKALSFGDLFG